VHNLVRRVYNLSRTTSINLSTSILERKRCASSFDLSNSFFQFTFSPRLGYLYLDAIILFSISFNLAFCLALFRETTAQIAAGNQPIKVIWSIKQIIPDNIFPLRKKDSQGIKIAIKVIFFLINFY